MSRRDGMHTIQKSLRDLESSVICVYSSRSKWVAVLHRDNYHYQQ